MGPLDDRERQLEGLMARYHHSGSALIEVLHAAQELYGYLSKPQLNDIAHKLRLPPSRVLGVATFYHLFRFAPHKAHTVTVCLGTACYAAGASELMETVRERCPAERWSIEAGRCVGSCGLAPIVISDGEPLCRLTPQSLEQHLKEHK